MKKMSAGRTHGHGTAAGERSERLALLPIAVLAFGAVLFASAWAIGGQDATSDNWVGLTTVIALFTGLIGALAALVMSVVDAAKHDLPPRLLPLVTFPSILAIVVALEAFVFE
jgi:hypothetical protein